MNRSDSVEYLIVRL